MLELIAKGEEDCVQALTPHQGYCGEGFIEYLYQMPDCFMNNDVWEIACDVYTILPAESFSIIIIQLPVQQDST